MRPALLPMGGERGGAPPANSNADDRESRGVELAPPDPNYGQEAGDLHLHVSRSPLVLEAAPLRPDDGVPRPTPARPAQLEQAWTLRPFDKWAAESFTGVHGVVTHDDHAAQYGGMRPWDEQRRTLRDLPADSWDAGIVANPTSAQPGDW